MRLDSKSSKEGGKLQRPSLVGSSWPDQTYTANSISAISTVGEHTASTSKPALTTPTSSTPLLHVEDRATGDIFLVDSGAEVSIIMPRPGDKEAAVGTKLTVANGSAIKTYGKRKCKIDLLCGEFTWFFIVAQAKNIIGADMLQRFWLLVDLRGRRLINFMSWSIVEGYIKNVPNGMRGICMVATSVSGSFSEEILQLVKQSPKLTEQRFQLSEAAHGIEHEIVTTRPPVRCSRDARIQRKRPSQRRSSTSS